MAGVGEARTGQSHRKIALLRTMLVPCNVHAFNWCLGPVFHKATLGSPCHRMIMPPNRLVPIVDVLTTCPTLHKVASHLANARFLLTGTASRAVDVWGRFIEVAVPGLRWGATCSHTPVPAYQCAYQCLCRPSQSCMLCFCTSLHAQDSFEGTCMCAST